jgi:hypothetical protein
MADDTPKEEKKLTAYQELQAAAGEARQYEGLLSRFAHLPQASGLAAKLAEDAGDSEAAAALAEPPEGMQYVPFLQLGASRADKRFEDLTKNRLNDIIDSAPEEKIDQYLTISAQQIDPEKMGAYGEVTAAYQEIGRIQGIIHALNEGKTDLVEAPMMQILSDYYDEQYPDDDDEDNQFLKQGLKLLALKNPKFRTAKFGSIAKEIVEKKKKFISEQLEGKKADYIRTVLSQEIPAPEGQEPQKDAMEQLLYAVLLREEGQR